jgi:hypothetical protein
MRIAPNGLVAADWIRDNLQFQYFSRCRDCM